MNVKDILAKAAKAVDEAGLEKDLRQAGFEKAIDLIAASEGFAPSAAAPTGATSAGVAAAAAESASGGSGLAKVATKLKVDLAAVEEIYHEKDGNFEIVISASKIDDGKSPGTKQLAMLVAAVRQGAEVEDWTDIDQIRKAVVDFGRYDGPNFATSVKSVAGFQFRQEGKKLLVRLSRPGWENATTLVKKLAGVE